ncbi:unnamed protein product [Linum trigynum]|uniref:Uncharacterized protein n=1 Tax=Linum trigynum TaxID=586398 RepID=A0AAV2D8Z1_9ROSI
MGKSKKVPESSTLIKGGKEAPHLYIDFGDKDKDEYAHFASQTYGEHRSISWEVLKGFGATAAIRDLSQEPAWPKLLAINEKIYVETTFEFLTMLTCSVLTINRHFPRTLSFSIVGVPRVMSFNEFTEAMDIYPPGFIFNQEGLVLHGEELASCHHLEDFFTIHLKSKDHQAPFNPKSTKSTSLMPKWRILHNIISYSVTPKEKSTSNLTKRDLDLLRSMFIEPRLNLWLVILKTLYKDITNLTVKTIHSGVYWGSPIQDASSGDYQWQEDHQGYNPLTTQLFSFKGLNRLPHSLGLMPPKLQPSSSRTPFSLKRTPSLLRIMGRFNFY